MNPLKSIAKKILGGERRKFAPEPTGIQAGPLKGRKLLLDTRASGSWRLMAAGEFEAFLYARMQASRDWSGAAVWDVGAHFGYHTLGLAALVGEAGGVVSFEPNPALRERLRENLALNPDLEPLVNLREAAVSRGSGQAEMICSRLVDGNASWSRLLDSKAPLPADSYLDFENVQTPVISLDDWWKQTGDRPPQLIKIDVEGSEFDALEGGESVIREHRPALAVEIHDAADADRFRKLCAEWDYAPELLESAGDRRFFWAESKTT